MQCDHGSRIGAISAVGVPIKRAIIRISVVEYEIPVGVVVGYGRMISRQEYWSLTGDKSMTESRSGDLQRVCAGREIRNRICRFIRRGERECVTSPVASNRLVASRKDECVVTGRSSYIFKIPYS